EPSKKLLGLPFRMDGSKQAETKYIIISRCHNRIRHNRYAPKKRKNFCIDSVPGKQPSINGIARMYDPAGHTCHQGFNDLTLTKAKDLHLERSTNLRSNPKFVQHQMRWYTAYDRLHYFGQCK